MPTVTTVRTQGGIYPPALNGIFQGFGHAVSTGRMEWGEAVDSILALDNGDHGSMRATLTAVRGILAQAGRRELLGRDLRSTLSMLRGSNPGGSLGGLYVEVRGHHSGRPAAWRSTHAMVQNASAGGMDDLTGTPLAAMAHLLLEGHLSTPGVTSPEASVPADRLIAALVQLGVADVEDLFEPALVPVNVPGD
jgi:hypothetical protein